MTGIGSICAAYGCNNYRWPCASRSFYRFPRNREICKQWVIWSRRTDLDDIFKRDGPEQLNKSYVVCSDHFVQKDFRNKNLLSQGLWPGSIPSVLPSVKEINPKRSQKKRKREEELESETTVGGESEVEVKTSEMVEETMFIKCEPEWLQDASGTDPLVPSGSTGSGEYADIKDEPHTEDFPPEMMEGTVKSEPDWNDSVCEDIKNEITIEEDNILNIWKDHSYAEYSPDIGEGDPDEDGVVNFEDGKDILCELCNKTFTEQSSLVKHMLQHSEIKTYACELCPKIFKRQAYLTEHMSMHTKECFTCGICNQTFATSAQLYAHRAVHISKQGYICSECNKSFIGEPSLQPLCAGENKYSCPECKKKGAEISVPGPPPVGNNSEKTYSCLYCMKTYAFRSSLRYHMTVHRKKQPHDCMLCERNFQRKSALIKHLKKCHHLFQERDPLQ